MAAHPVGGPLPDDVQLSSGEERLHLPDVRDPDVVLAFFRERAELEASVEGLGQAVFPDRSLWVAWPRRGGGHASDITDNAIRAVVLPHGLVDVKVAALSQDWSGLKLVWRKQLRPRR